MQKPQSNIQRGTKYYQDINSPLGTIRLVASDSSLLGCYFHGQKYFPDITQEWIEASDHPVIELIKTALFDYFEGKVSLSDLPLDLAGTPFQQTVWQALLTIPYGETTTYGELAEAMGRPKSTRAVAAAIGRNPVSVIVPCHRVIGKSGSLTGYAGGLNRKRKLLELEGVLVTGNKSLSTIHQASSQQAN